MYNVTTDDGVIVGVVAGLRCSFLIDSGAQVNTFTEDLFQELISNPKHRDEVFEVKYQTDRPLKAYATVGEIKVVATFLAYLFISDDRPLLLEKFYVVSEVRALLGRSTASRYSILMLGLKVPVQSQRFGSHISLIAGEIATIATNEIFPKFNLPPVKIHYDRSKPPCRNIFLNIPLAVRPLVEKRIQELINANIIEPVVEGMDTSFCSSMLVVPKGKNDIRLVIDLRGPNRNIFRTPFSMPTLEQILAELDGATWFSTIDIANAFFHIELDEESRHLTNFFTEFGMFRCVRLPFGLCNTPDLFQETLQRNIFLDVKAAKIIKMIFLSLDRVKKSMTKIWPQSWRAWPITMLSLKQMCFWQPDRWISGFHLDATRLDDRERETFSGQTFPNPSQLLRGQKLSRIGYVCGQIHYTSSNQNGIFASTCGFGKVLLDQK